MENPEKTQTPPATPAPGSEQQTTPDNGTQDQELVSINKDELDALKRDAGRWKANKATPQRPPRRKPSTKDGSEGEDAADPEVLRELETLRQEKERAVSEAKQLKLKDGLSRLLEKDDFKGLPAATKKLLLDKPMAFVQEDSETVEHYLEDIEYYLGAEIIPTLEGDKGPVVPQEQINNTPPAKGSGAQALDQGELEEITPGMSEQQRAGVALRNTMKKAGLKKL